MSKVSCCKHDLELLKENRGMTGKEPESMATIRALNFEQVEQTSMAAFDLLCASAFLNPDSIPLELITLGAMELGPALSTAFAHVDGQTQTIDAVLDPLTQHALIRRERESQTYSIHTLVQAALKEEMDETTQHHWVERTVRAVNRAFPDVEFSKWALCERLTPHAQACAELIDKWELVFEEAGRLLNEAGIYLYERGRFDEAEPLLKQALSIWEKSLGPDHPNVAKSLNNLAGLYGAQGKYSQVEMLYKQSLDIIERTVGPDHPVVANLLNNLAALDYAQGQYADADSLYQRALAIREQVLGSDHPDVAQSLNNLAALYYAQGKYVEAEPLYQRVLAILEQAFGHDHPDVARSLNNLAALYDAQGKSLEAESLCQRALKILVKALGAEHPDVAHIHKNLKALYDDRGKSIESSSLSQ